MSKKNLLIIAALLVVVAIFVQLYPKSKNRKQDKFVGEPLVSVNIIEAINEVEIKKGDKSIHLNKTADNWIVSEKDGFPANIEKLLNLLDNLTSYRVASLITKDESRFDDFKLGGNSPNETAHFLLKDGEKTLFKLMLGKSRDSKSTNANRPSHPDGTYIRIGDEEAIYLIKENLSFDTDVDDWINQTLIAIATDDIQSIQFESPNSRFSFSRDSKESDIKLADLADSEKIDSQAVNDLLEELNELKIETATPLNEKAEANLQLKTEITAVLFDKSTLNFQVLLQKIKNPLAKEDEEKEETKYFLKVVGADDKGDHASLIQVNRLGKKWLFEMDEWRAKHWLKNRKEFLKTDTE